jgi:UDP-galactopyranose mutase
MKPSSELSVAKTSTRLPRRFDWVVVGCGLTGATFAHELAEKASARVLVVDRRPHIGGNVYDCLDDNGVRVQQYGAHIFHTSSHGVWDFLSRFTDWYPYEHRVLASVDDQLIPLPFNFTSLQALLPDDAASLQAQLRKEFPTEDRVPVAALVSAEHPAVRDLGELISDKIFRNYTAKQWGRPIEQVDASVLARVPVALSTDDRYFRDRYQAIPVDGYTAMVARMLDHPLIEVANQVDGKEAIEAHPAARVLWSGQIDAYFDYQYGELPYRSLGFTHRQQAGWRTLPVAVVNYPGSAPFTRVIDHSHFSARKTTNSTLTYEYPSPYLAGENEPFYPVVDEQSRRQHARYLEAAASLAGRVLFGGRLGDFRYYDMHQAVGRALTLSSEVLEGRPDRVARQLTAAS